MRKPFIAVAVALALALTATACGGDDGGSDPESSSDSTSGNSLGIDISEPCPGPNGEEATPPEDVELSADQIAEVREGNYTAAVTWAGSGPWYDAVDRGFDDALEELNIERVASASAEYDTATQQADVENAMALDPDVVLGSPVDAVAAAEAYKPVVDAGKVLVLSDNAPEGYSAGEDYTGFVGGDRCAGALMMADLMAEAVGEDGKIGMIYYDADYYVTNILDDYFRAAVEERYPDMEIVEEAGFAEEAGTQEVANAMLAQNPEIEGLYVTWSIAAQGALAAIREAGRDDVKVVTHDLDPTNDVEIASGGAVYATVVEDLYDLGYNLGKVAALGLLGEEAPAFVAVPYVQATQDSIVEAYPEVLGVDAPPEVVQAAEGG